MKNILIGLLFLGSTAFAADHVDGGLATGEPAADITDVYAWMTTDASKLNLVMAVGGLSAGSSLTAFSDAVTYTFFVNNMAGYGQAATETQVTCTFSAVAEGSAQTTTCTVGGEVVVNAMDASATTGVTNTAGTFRVFAGLRKDPFFFDLVNFNAVQAAVVNTAATADPPLVFDNANCPAIDTGTRDALATALTGGDNGVTIAGSQSPAVNTFAGNNVLAIVIQADKTLFGSQAVYAVSAATSR